MDHEIKANLYPCAHCGQSGTCTSGEGGYSCSACVKASELKGKHFGLKCGVCDGIGVAEPVTERMNKRIKPVLAVVLAFTLLGGLYAAALLKSPHFTEILALTSTLLGSIVTYYFMNSRAKA